MAQETETKFHRIPQKGVASPEEILSVVPRPDLPILTSYYSATSKGGVVADGGPGGPFGHGRMNGHIEDILRIIASMGKPDKIVPMLGEGVMGLGLTVNTPEEFTRNTRRYIESERKVFYVKPQEGEEFEKKLNESGVKKIAITIGDNDGDRKIGEIVTLLRPETKFSVFDQKGYLRRLIIEI